VADFYLDENVAERLADELRSLGHDAASTTQLGNKGRSDPRQLDVAMDLNRILVTHNEADFVMLHEAWQAWSVRWGVVGIALHPGILVIPQNLRLSVAQMATAIDSLLVVERAIANRLLILQRSGNWFEPA
jgi:hypothetical protein